MSQPIQVLIVSKGHDYDHNAFLAMFAQMPDIEITLVEQPAAQILLQPEHVSRYQAVLFYDMSGIPGAGLKHDLADAQGQPDPAYAYAMGELIAHGTGLVLLNHAVVSWPNWPLWRRITGSSFMLREGPLHGELVPGSGYRGGHGPLPNATVRLAPAADHPVLEGLADGFEITDELYLKTPQFESDVLPLLRADYDFTMQNFTPPPLAPADEQANWQHPPGSDLLVWARRAGNSAVVVSELGDGPEAFTNAGFVTLLHNALRWVSSPAAQDWVQQQPEKI